MSDKKNINEDGTLKVFSYHPETGEYVGEDIAFPNPLEEGQYIIPAYSTVVEPPKEQEGKVIVWTGLQWSFEDIVVSKEQKAAEARYRRNSLLAQSDWRMFPDIPDKHVTSWAIYRQSLRDLPQQEGFPETINWPTAPTT